MGNLHCQLIEVLITQGIIEAHLRVCSYRGVFTGRSDCEKNGCFIIPADGFP